MTDFEKLTFCSGGNLNYFIDILWKKQGVLLIIDTFQKT